MEDRKYFIHISGKNYGPFTYTQVQGALGRNRINRGTYVFKEGMTKWEPLGELPEFNLRGPTQAPPPPPSPESRVGFSDEKRGKWVVFDNFQKTHFLNTDELLALVKAKKVRRSTFVWREGMNGWKKMTELDEFRSYTYPNLDEESISPTAANLIGSSTDEMPGGGPQRYNIGPSEPSKITRVYGDEHYEKNVFPVVEETGGMFNWWAFFFPIWWLPLKGIWWPWIIVSGVTLSYSLYIDYQIKTLMQNFSKDILFQLLLQGSLLFIFVGLITGYYSNGLYYLKFKRFLRKGKSLSGGSVAVAVASLIIVGFIHQAASTWMGGSIHEYNEAVQRNMEIEESKEIKGCSPIWRDVITRTTRRWKIGSSISVLSQKPYSIMRLNRDKKMEFRQSKQGIKEKTINHVTAIASGSKKRDRINSLIFELNKPLLSSKLLFSPRNMYDAHKKLSGGKDLYVWECKDIRIKASVTMPLSSMKKPKYMYQFTKMKMSAKKKRVKKRSKVKRKGKR